jgi:uncharacterized membrane protein
LTFGNTVKPVPLVVSEAKPHQKRSTRVAYVDWMRGLACVLMFQTHCYDSWLAENLRHSTFYRVSQLLGTLPAPLFLFLTGVSQALVTERLRQKGIEPDAIARASLKRGFQIYLLGWGFRFQEYVLGLPWAPWTDLFRVDILNIIGISLMLIGVLHRVATSRFAATGGSILAALAVAVLTPLLWTTYRPAWLPWPLESYVNGLTRPWLFPIFPWVAFAFAGLAAGYQIFSPEGRERPFTVVVRLAGIGMFVGIVAYALDHMKFQLYASYDFWHTSPNFLVLRVAVLLGILLGSYLWCRWLGERGFSPIIQLGNTSLLVYWVHIEFVYGRFSILPKRASSLLLATIGLALIFLAMLALSIARTRLKGRGPEVLGRFRSRFLRVTVPRQTR